MKRLDVDHEIALRAVEILIDALTQKQMRGVVEMRQCVDALKKYLENPNPDTAAFASRAFNALDGSLREMVAEIAIETAHAAVGKLPGVVARKTSAKAAAKPKVEAEGWFGFGRAKR